MDSKTEALLEAIDPTPLIDRWENQVLQKTWHTLTTCIRAWRPPFLAFRQEGLFHYAKGICAKSYLMIPSHNKKRSENITPTLPQNPPCSPLVPVPTYILPFLMSRHHSEF